MPPEKLLMSSILLSIKRSFIRRVEKMLRVVEVATQKQIQSKIGLDFNYAIAYSEKKFKNLQVFSDGYWTYIRLAENS